MKALLYDLDICVLTVLAVVLAACSLPASAATEAGKFQFVVGEVRVVSASGAERTPVKGDAFNAGDTIITGPSGTTQIRMTDGGLIAVRADTQMKLDQYVFNGREDGSERKLVSLIKGGFRAITGLIGNRNKENYRILTPSATIGIRGTDHEPVVVPPGAAGGFQAGTYERVYRGAAIIETDKGKLIVNPNQVGFTPGKGASPVLLPKVPEFYDKKEQRPEESKDPQKDSKESGDGKTSDSRSTDIRTLKEEAKEAIGSDKTDLKSTTGSRALTVTKESAASDPSTTLRSPLESVRDTGATTFKSDSLKSESLSPVSPLTDIPTRSSTTTLKDTSSTTKTEILTIPTTTLRSTESIPTKTPAATSITTTPITTTPVTTKSTTTTTTTPVTIPRTTTTTTETLKAPTTTTIKK